MAPHLSPLRHGVASLAGLAKAGHGLVCWVPKSNAGICLHGGRVAIRKFVPFPGPPGSAAGQAETKHALHMRTRLQSTHNGAPGHMTFYEGVGPNFSDLPVTGVKVFRVLHIDSSRDSIPGLPQQACGSGIRALLQGEQTYLLRIRHIQIPVHANMRVRRGV